MPLAIHFYDAITAGKNPAEGQVVRYDSLICEESGPFQALEVNVALRKDVHVELESASESELLSMDLDGGVKEVVWAKLVHTHLTKPECLHVGYGNTTRIDPYIRFALYRNLLPYPCAGLPPTSHFLDLDTILRAISVLRPPEFPWTKAPNPIASSALHHYLMWEVKASGDNRAVRLRELFAEAFNSSPKLGDHALGLTSIKLIKHQLGLDRGEVSDLDSTTPSFILHPTILCKRGFVIGMPVAVDITYPDVLYVADLEADLSVLCDPHISSYQDLVRTNALETSRPLVRVSLGRIPFCAPLGVIRVEDASRLQVDIGHVKRSIKKLRDAGHLAARLRDLPILTLPPQPADVYHRMWAGDFSPGDQALMVELHRNPECEWLRIASRATDGRFQDLVLRMLSSVAPEVLSEAQLAESQRYENSRRGPKKAPPLWIAEILKQGQDTRRLSGSASGLLQLYERYHGDIR